MPEGVDQSEGNHIKYRHQQFFEKTIGKSVIQGKVNPASVFGQWCESPPAVKMAERAFLQFHDNKSGRFIEIARCEMLFYSMKINV